MKDKFEEIKTYFKEQKISNPSIEINNNSIEFHNRLFYYNSLADFILLGITVICKEQFDILFYPALIIIVLMLWFDIKDINTSAFDITKDLLTIKPEILFIKSNRIPFTDISEFYVEDCGYSHYKKWKIFCLLKTGRAYCLNQFNCEEDAIFFVTSINKILNCKLENRNIIYDY
jgi:hypothetical protein